MKIIVNNKAEFDSIINQLKHEPDQKEINQAADKAGFQEASIKRCCKGKQKKHAGYRWMFYKKILEKQLKEMG